ncbi:HlyD family efflux transporter periplasmic adaptor subunit [Pseudoalteromonas luteoviolacea]|uniref:HlyD family secretion protein n=1 Tax=Pseudoalteromonas luteoviolacea TaxID=43657 RepID=UPI001B3A70CC|nr:HlyD family efflux transporter periplasmic adaptor subunit [Pseudoalteromonas luteoviolacea]MBQ4879962.1 HlyD family efflux transporter periplasmic adaptor subunit [Pseudoalteromonas luteoviolacea]MBQ4908979.1 HlyD family efflux transporter periplasmic adaptor subunit [Pseudoalteromonas luteoviolacea]
MDVKRSEANNRSRRHGKKWIYIFAVAVISVAGYLFKGIFGNASYIVDQDNIQLAKVTSGDFKVNVRSSGVLRPTDIRWVSSRVSGKVEQIHVKPGNVVTMGEKLVTLSDPELFVELDKSRWQVRATEAENTAALVEMESQLLQLDNAVTEAKFGYESAKLRLDAEEQLLKAGNGSISTIEYEKTKLEVQQFYSRWEAQKERKKKMVENLSARIIANEAKLGQIQNDFERVRQQVEDLVVTATITGVVQEVPLLLGQQSAVGSNIALIAEPTSLIAELQVQELQIRNVELGQNVVIDTRSSLIEGAVSRINPAVENGVVQVEVKLLSDLPAEARPDLNIEGNIEVSNIQDTLFVRRPSFSPANRRVGLYKLDETLAFAQKTQVQLGVSSVNEVQVLAGLKVGDTIVISDTSAWATHETVKIN